jgi:Uma2 family endonuclease
MATVETLLTAEEFGSMPDDGRRTELVRGRIVELPPPKRRHAKALQRISQFLGNFVDAHDLGHVLSGDGGIITERNPDTVRGADVAYFSFGRLPRGDVSDDYAVIPPELVFEIRSTSDRWREIEEKVAEYHLAGVRVVCVLDSEPKMAHLYYPSQPKLTLGPDEELTFPELLPGFRVLVRSLFV